MIKQQEGKNDSRSTPVISILTSLLLFLPAALLAKSLFPTVNSYFGGLRMKLTNFMASMIVSAFTKVSCASINQARRNLGAIARHSGSL